MPRQLRHQLWIIAVAAAVLFTNLGSAALWDEDEPLYASCAREMLQRGDWVVPTFNGEVFPEKPPRRVWDHWLRYNLPPDSTGLPVGVRSHALPSGTLEGINSWGRTGYGGPCPPIGRHRYFHILYALDVVLPDLRHPKKDQLLSVMEGHILAQTELVGTYEKSR